jgi:prepilin-type N-terminal cleavage/methylation domain-containing protein
MKLKTVANSEDTDMQTTHSSFSLKPFALHKGSSLIPAPSSVRAFTLVELLVVIGLIAVLVSITVPIAGKIRKSSQEAATRALIGQIESACAAYYSDFNAYPGPMGAGFMTTDQTLSSGGGAAEIAWFNPKVNNDSENLTNNPGLQPGWNGLDTAVQRLTGTENLVLGLMGGLERHSTDAARKTFRGESLGLGPMKFNPKRPGRSTAYMQATNLSEGLLNQDDLAQDDPQLVSRKIAKDTRVPEFIDSFGNPMPILYLRARKGSAATVLPNQINERNNNVITDQIAGMAGQYNLLEIAAYTQSAIGIGRSIKESEYKGHDGSPLEKYPHGLISIDAVTTANKPLLLNRQQAMKFPYDAYAYFTDPASDDPSLGNAARLAKHRARKQDSFILISAGVDRVYGTEDDITNFGSVLP